MTRPYFVRERVTHFESFDKHSATVIAKLKERFIQGEAIDFQVRLRAKRSRVIYTIDAGHHVKVHTRLRDGVLVWILRKQPRRTTTIRAQLATPKDLVGNAP